MAWHKLWPEFVKKRLCRYLLQHYLGHFFKEKISLEQLSIDIYNGTGYVKNLNLDCDALNEQINAATSFSNSTSSSSSNNTSSVPIEIVSGFVGYISVYIPWHDLFNDYCKLTIKNVQITIRTKQRKPTMPMDHQFGGRSRPFDSFNDLNLNDDGTNSNPMFSSIFIDSLMNTSMHIAQECLHEQDDSTYDDFKSTSTKKKTTDIDDDLGLDDETNNSTNNSLPGLEAFKGLIDSILSRIKINLEQIQIRIENLDTNNNVSTSFRSSENDFGHVMSSSTLFNNKPSNGIALELRIKSIKYFDLDSASSSSSSQQNSSANSSLNSQDQNSLPSSNPARNTTKSFNIEGLTIYFDEFIIKDDSENDLNENNNANRTQNETLEQNIGGDTASLNTTVDLSNTTLSSDINSFNLSPQDEAPPFNFQLDSNYYLYTNPIICLTFSGIQSIKLTINNLTPTDLILEATDNSSLSSDKLNSNQQRPLLELSAQFGSIKCLLCPKQIHLLTEMFTKLNEYIEAANATKKAIKALQQKRRNSKSNKQIRGCDKRNYETLIKTELGSMIDKNLGDLDEEEEYFNNDDDNYKSIELTNNSNDTETSVMFYSMMSESTALNMDNGQGGFTSSFSNKFQEEKKNSNENLNELDDDKKQILFTNQLKQTIEQLRTDVIVANNSTSNSSSSRHNLFQTFKITFRMLSLTVLHHDPPVLSSSQNEAKQKQSSSSNTNRLIVDRMKHISDGYFDWVSTIDASSSSSTSSQSSIDRNIIMKFHQASAFNDHFLVLLKPINFNMIEKINQRSLSLNSSLGGKSSLGGYFGSSQKQQQSQVIQYALNDILLTIGYIQINEYLVPETSLNDKNANKKTAGDRTSRRFKLPQIIETSRNAIISEIVHFSDIDPKSQQQQNIEQPCFKLQVVTYEPLDSLLSLPKVRNNLLKNSNMSSSMTSNQFDINIQNQLLNRQFEDVCITLNQCLMCELDVSIIDRLYYLVNDVTKISNENINKRKVSNVQFQSKSMNADKIQNVKNLEIKCNQIIKFALRFPIADLRRTAGTNNSTNKSKKNEKESSLDAATSNSEIKNETKQNAKMLIARPVTMAAFRRLREQILTLHIFDFHFQTLLNSLPSLSLQTSDRQLTIVCSQINAYYQYSRKERPIHFGLIQQKPNESRTLIFSIKLPVNDSNSNEYASDFQTLTEETNQFGLHENDSLRQNFNINVGKANKFFNQTIKEENENDNEESEANLNELPNDPILNNQQQENLNNNENGDENDDDDDEEIGYGPFSRIHSLISSEKNRRIVNAGSKSEMHTFIQKSKTNSQTVIKIQLPQLKLLIADQKFLNDIYNCFLNDLIMWVPSQLPPIESSLNLYDPSAAAAGFMVPPSLNYLIDSNFDADFLLNLNQNKSVKSDEDVQEKDVDGKQFHMCKSAILKSPNSNSESENSDNCESDDDKSKRKYQQKFDSYNTKTQKQQQQQKNKQNKNTMCVILNVETAHLKAFVLNNLTSSDAACGSVSPINSLPKGITDTNPLKYGEFDIKTNNFSLCIAISEQLKHEKKLNEKKRKSSKSKGKNKNSREKNQAESDSLLATSFKIEKQYICLFTDQINISHSTKTCPVNVTQLKYPTNFASFEQLFQMSKTKDLITSNDPSVISSLFTNETNENLSVQTTSNVVIPMVSIGIKSKFNTKTNTKQLLVALNFNNLSLHHSFCSQVDYWIFQLILLFDLIDIDIIGYEAPIVLTELHLNVANSCILYKPIYLATRSLIAFKSLHWSSNVTAESSLTLLVFNIEDIYLFLSKINNQQQATTSNAHIKENESGDSFEAINLKRDYICVANSDLFELRLLISDEQKSSPPPAYASGSDSNSNKDKSIEPRKTPLLDIKLRSNLIQLRTCVDSAFTLIELINYIVSDGDLHQLNPIMSEFMVQNVMSAVPPAPPSVEPQQPNVVEELSNAISSTENNMQSIKVDSTRAINITTSIPINPSLSQQQTTTFTVGTPPPSSSFKSSSSSTSLNHQQFYSPIKHNSSSSSHLSSFQDNQTFIQQKQAVAPPLISSPSLSFNYKKAIQLQQNTSSSAESLISDMVKEAIQSNPMTQSIIGSLEPVNSKKSKPIGVGGRKRNTSLNLPSPDLQTKRMLNRKESFDEAHLQINSTNTTLKGAVLREKNLNIHKDMREDDNENVFELNKNLINFNEDDDKENGDEGDDDDDEIADGLIKSMRQTEKNIIESEDDESNEFQFDLPFSDLSPFSARGGVGSSKLKSSVPVQRQLQFDKKNRKLYFKSNVDSNEEDEEINENDGSDEDDDDDKELLRDFDVIDVLPGFGEPPRNNQEFEIKILKNNSAAHQQSNQKYGHHFRANTLIEIKEDHFKKPLTKIDVLKAPETYPCPLNVYCVQEISINWCLYGGSDFGNGQIGKNEDQIGEQTLSISPATQLQSKNRMNRTVSSPIIVTGNTPASTIAGSPSANSPAFFAVARSRNNSTSSNSLSISPHSQMQHYQSPPKQQSSLNATSPSALSSVKFSSKSASVNFAKEKYLPRKAGGRIINKYDTNSLNWLARGGKERNLDVCMEIALHKVKTKVDLYADLNKDDDANENSNENESPYLYRVALAIGDIEIRDKLASSAFNMFLFRYESESCPKHTNSNMIFLKFLCSKSMDAQRLLECDIKVSIQPLRFNIDQDALIFLVEFFTKMASKDLNEFSKTLVPPPPPPPTPLHAQSGQFIYSDETAEVVASPPQNVQKTPQEVFIRNFIFSPDLLVKFDFSGKYDKRPDTKMDTITKLLMFAIQLSNTEIKLKRVYYRRGFLGAEKLFQALLKEWLSDIQRNQMKNLIKGYGIFNSLIQFFEGFTYLIWYPIEQYRKDGRVLCGIQKGGAAFSTCTVLATIELTNRMFQATKNVAEFFYDLVTPHRSNSHHYHSLNTIGYGSNNNALVETLLTGVGNNRNIRLRRQPNDIREGLTNAYYVMYEGINDTAANFMQEVNQGAEHKGLPGAIGGALRQLPSAALAPIVLGTEATCNFLIGIRNQLKPDEKKDDDRKWKTINN